jgi:hypothetical protein
LPGIGGESEREREREREVSEGREEAAAARHHSAPALLIRRTEARYAHGHLLPFLSTR